MKHIKDLLEKNDKNQAPIANRILWKVEQENEFISKQIKQIKQSRIRIKKSFDEKKAIYQYVRGDHRFHLSDEKSSEIFDIMISFCQADKKLPYDIYNRLITSNVYRISFDKDNIHCRNPEAMAKAIEKSNIIIICFSTEYRKSYACRLEAEYAKKRERPIIPVKIDFGYDPTGWLEEIIGNEKIDFTKEFNTAYAQLINQINEVNGKINKN